MKLNLKSVLDTRLNLRWKSILGLGFLLTTALLVMGGVIYSQGLQVAIDELLETTRSDIEKDARTIENFIENVQDDLLLLAGTPPVQGIIRADDNSGLDPLTGDTAEQWRGRLEQISGAFLKYHPEYLGICYLDEKGDELVRANLTGERVWFTPQNELQNRAQASYVTGAIRLKENEVYFSEISLQSELEQTQTPLRSLFRIAVPVYQDQKGVRGLVVFTVNGEALFADIGTAIGMTKKYIINQDGYFLVHPDQTSAPGLGFDNDHGLGNETSNESMAEYAEGLQTSDSQVNYHRKLHHIEAFRKVYYNPQDLTQWWAVIYDIPEAMAFKNINKARDTMLVVGLFILICALLVIMWAAARMLVLPIVALSKAVKSFEGGNFSVRVPEDGRRDELGELVVSVNSMASLIEQNQRELTILNRITVAAASSLSIPVMGNNVLEAILDLELLQFQKKAGLFVVDKKSRSLTLVASKGFSQEQEALDAVVPFGVCLCGMAAETGEPLFSEGCCEDCRHTHKYSGMLPHRHIIIPLKSGQTVIGVLALYLPDDKIISPDNIQISQFVGEIIANSLQNVLQFAKSEKLKVQNQLILDSMGEGLYELNNEGICTFINSIAEQMLGYEAGELIGSVLHDITHHTRPDGSVYPWKECNIFRSFTKNISQYCDDEVFWRKDGSSFLVEYTSTSVRDENNLVIGAVVVFSDITEKKRLEEKTVESTERYISLYEGIDDALFVHGISPDGSSTNFLEVNAITCQRLGYSREELLLMGPGDIDAPGAATDMSRVAQEVMAGKSVTFDQIHVTKDGRQIPVEIRSRVFLLHGQRAVMSLARDITERRQQETQERNRSRVLESLTSGKTLAQVLELIAQSVETDNPAALCSIMLMDDEGRHLLHGAAPSLPDYFCQAIDGLEIGEEAGSCGRAAFIKERVIVEDLLNHPYWANFQELVVKAGLRSCWSEPILSSDGRVLGTFAIYHRQPQKPDLEDITHIKIAADYARLAIERKRAEQTIQRREERYRSLVTASAQIVWTANAEGEVVNELPTWQAYTGQSMEEIRGWGWSDALHPEDREQTAAAWMRAVEGRTLYSVEYRIRKKDGTYRLFATRGVPVLEEDGAIREWVGTCTDITERRQAEEKIKEYAETLESKVNERTLELQNATLELKKLFNAIEQSDESIVITDKNGTIQYVNPIFTSRTGYSKEEAIGNNPRMLNSGLNPRKVYADLWKTILSGKPWKGTLINKKKSGEFYYEDANIAPVLDEQGTITNFVAVKADVTDRIRAAEELKKKNDELEVAKEVAETANQAKSDFLANMSHEIRTPMNAILGMSHLALNTELTPKQQDYISKVQSSAYSLLGIINDILDFSKIEAGKLDIESAPFQLDDVFSELANLVGLKAEEKKLELLFRIDPDTPVSLIGDALRLKQILVNLANNAVKFTETGEVVVSVAPVEKKGSKVRLQFSIEDSGIGLTEEQQKKLFRAFSQADASTTRKYGGTGLGLTISKKLCEMMGGEISVKSVPGQGSTFIFTAALDINTGKTMSLLPQADLQGLPVLVVDDNHSSREIMEEMLTSLSMLVSQAASGAEAVKKIVRADQNGNPFQLVYMDWRMPELNGIETARKIKELDLSLQPKIVMVTAYGREEIIQQAEQLDLNGFMTKPVTRFQLYDITAQAFGKMEHIAQQTKADKAGNLEALQEIKGVRILLAEDNTINQQVALEILKQAHLMVDLADNGLQALEMAEKNRYDLILMDIQMPEMNGIESTRAIRASEPDGENIPIIAMTAHAMAGDREKSLAAGMNDHITKPIEPDILFGTLLKWLKQKHRPEENIEKVEPLKEKGELQLPDSLPGIDIPSALPRVAGNKKLYAELLISFLQENGESTSHIKKALQEKDQELAHRLVHTVKGVGGTLGARDLQAAAGELEGAIMGGQMEGLEGLVQAFDQQLQIVMEGLKKFASDHA